MIPTVELTSKIDVRLIQSAGGDHMVVAAAKVSTSGEEAAKLASTPANDQYGLIKYLMVHRHGTPFEHGSLTFFVSAPIFVFREWHRHRVGWSYNEESARYKNLEPKFWVPRRDRLMTPAPGFKSARPAFEAASEAQYQMVLTDMTVAYRTAYTNYLSMLKIDIAREVARSVLPVGIYSSCWCTANPRSLMHFLSLRTQHADAKFPSYPQAEIAEAAAVCEIMFKQGWPLCWRAWNECGRVAP